MRAAPEARRRSSASWLPDVTVGLVLGALGVTFSISLTALIFGAEVQTHMARTIGMVLTGSILLSLVVSLLTSARGMIAHVQDAPAAVLGALAAGVAGSSRITASGTEELWLTTLALVIVTTLLTGALYFAVGAFGLGGLVRYLPYPVLGGFMAGTGWLLLTGGIGIMSGVNLIALSDVPSLFAVGTLWLWLPGVALAALLLVLSQRLKHFLVWPLSLLAATGVFYLVMSLRGGTVAQWREAGLLVGPFPQGSLFDPLRAAELAGVRWDVVVAQAPGIVTVAFVCLIAVLLNATGIEQVAGRKVDLNRELRAAGLGNLLSGAFGGAPGYHGMSFTTFNYKAGSGGRLAAFIAAAVLATTLFFGAGVIQLLPKVVLGALVTFFGLGFLHDWLVAALRRLPLAEYLIMLAIFATIVALGVLPGVGVGLVLAVAMFVISSSRTEAVRYATDLTSHRSRVSRPLGEREVLARHGAETVVFQLQGFLFFGTATALAERLERLGAENGSETSGEAAVKDVVLDFQRVTGIDSSGISTVGGIARAASTAGIRLHICSAPASLRSRLTAALGSADTETSVGFHDGLDAALERCEQRTLNRHADPGPSADGESTTALDLAGAVLEQVSAFCERRELAAGETLIRRGDEAGALYFLVAGQLTAKLPSGARLETMRAGSLVGELAFYRAAPRSADVVADYSSTVLVLGVGALERMHAESPELAASLHQRIARHMAERVVHLVEAVDSLQR